MPSGWYPDPSGVGQRYWGGARWTEHYRGAPEAQGAPVATGYVEPYGHPVASPKSSKATWALVLGLLGIFLLPIVFSILAIVFGVSARGEIDRNPQIAGRGNATAGVVLGIIGLVGWALIFLAASGGEY
jgi:hypothetical protein